MKNCIACGMNMSEKSDFALGDESKDYCVYCANSDGSMQSFEQKKESMAKFIVKTQGLCAQAAETAALSMMKDLPAWKKHFRKS